MLCESIARRIKPRYLVVPQDFETGHPRGILQFLSDDVVAFVNGRPVTKSDILDGKRSRQAKHLQTVRRMGPVKKPGFVWVFRNAGFPYGGWWLYVLTVARSWELGYRRLGPYSKFTILAMRLFPCGLLPMRENFGPWMPIFAETYFRPTDKRPTDNGLALVRVISDRGNLLGIERF